MSSKAMKFDFSLFRRYCQQLQFIRDSADMFYSGHLGPSSIDVAYAYGWNSVSTQRDIAALRRIGYVQKSVGAHKKLFLTDAGKRATAYDVALEILHEKHSWAVPLLMRWRGVTVDFVADAKDD